MTPIKELPVVKQIVLAATALLVIAGIYDAICNLPIVSGCAFYGDCVAESFRDPPGAMGRDIP